MDKNYFAPNEIVGNYADIGAAKATMPLRKKILLGILAGAFVALACQGTNMAVHTIESVGTAKVLAGLMFPAALILIVVAGGELFTGSCLLIVACLQRKISWKAMLTSMLTIYISNFIGAMLVVFLVLGSGQMDFSSGLLGAYTLKTAVYKTGLSFPNAFCMGILCNWLVCMAVWMAAAAKDISGKILAIFFPIWLFVASGFEHCVANMYYIPMGILLKNNERFVSLAVSMGVSPDSIQSLGWGSFWGSNMLPVTLGNIVGGMVFVGIAYTLIYRKKTETKK